MENAPNGPVTLDDNPSDGENASCHSTEQATPKEVFVYRQDVVRLNIQPEPLGIVTEVAGEYDSDSSVSDFSESEEEEEEEEEKSNTVSGATGDVGSGDKNSDGGASPKVSDIDDLDSLDDGMIRVSWLDNTFTTEDITCVTVVDRSFLPGDIVASVSDPTGQLGQVVDVDITVDLRTGNGDMLRGVSSRGLKRVTEFTVGDFVVSGCWLGRVDEVIDNVTVLFDDGSVCKVNRADPLRLKPVVKPIFEDTSFPYYPGQRVKAVSSSVFKTSTWLSGLWKANRLEGVVTKVETVAVMVYWIASAYFGPSQLSIPPEKQNPRNLTLVSCFTHSNWQLADWCLLRSQPKQVLSYQTEMQENEEQLEHNLEVAVDGQPNGNLNGEGNVEDEHLGAAESLSQLKISKEQHQQPGHENVTYRKKLRKVFFRKVDKRARRREETFEKALFIANTETKVTVAWQDGTSQYRLGSTSLIPIHSPNDSDFFPDQYVVERAPNENEEPPPKNRRVGLVKSVDARDRTVLVNWLKTDFTFGGPKEFESELVSAYELEMHPDFDYCFGDVVVRLPPVSNPSEVSNADNGRSSETKEEYQDATGSPSKIDTDGDEANEETADSTSKRYLEGGEADGEETVVNLSWVGNIIGFSDGDIEVMWGDGTISKVGPNEVYVVGRDDEESFDGDSDGGASWETVDDTEMDTLDNTVEREQNSAHINAENASEKENDNASHCQDENNASQARAGPLSVPLAAIGYVTRFATGLFSRGKNRSNSESEDGPETSERTCSDDSEQEDSAVEGDVRINADPMVDASDAAMNIGDAEGFKHFDIMESPLDHHYLDSNGRGGTTGGKKWVRKVQQEWNILEKNLPDNIYVRVFEDRMDLIRAVIVGVPGTPYQDGLFFFDFLLPYDYPQVPPTTYYHSGGLRLNPNLYTDGKVCLSLLNTWTGKGNEVWDPSTSTILQVLVSIQGLVLNEKPYFNEAGYEKQVGTIEGEKNVLPYNENTYLLNLRSMLYLLKRPPQHFEDFVKDHFRRRGFYILKACRAYLQGFAIGSLTSDASPTEKSREHSCSLGFKLYLTKLLPRLFSSLRDIGVNCDEFEPLLKPENNQ
ncbi:hypothetical protein LUZ61_019542 [Rhynchospora tenuis]|uniref:E2 ubiquitin-conjugating enzyme n=1 Tax=Rhynchospora tenuis TaxID=198213 RepID=A0AAD6EMY9_9POAL|nr:hypothetical protein LUZ61_019542 [Rhynchospora tenuis]